MGQGHQGRGYQGRVEAVSVGDFTALAYLSRRPGCGKAVLHEDAAVQLSVYRVEPGSGVPAHTHSKVDDLFFSLLGEIEIRWANGYAVLREGSFCRIPCGTRHEIRNRSATDAFFLLAHTSYEQFDLVESK